MSRIPGISPERANPLVRFVYWMAKRQVKKLPEPLAVMAHSGSIFGAYAWFELLVQQAKSVPPVVIALAGVRTASLIGCPF